MVPTEIQIVPNYYSKFVKAVQLLGCMAGLLQFSKTSTVLIASHSCANGNADHHTLQGNIHNVTKACAAHWNGAYRNLSCVAVKLLHGAHGAGQLQFSKTSTVLIASRSCTDGDAGHHTVQGNIENVSKARILHWNGAHRNSSCAELLKC